MTSRSEFMVSVDGRSAPTKVHGSCAEAMVEAERLANQAQNRGAVIRVVEVVKVLEPCHKWRGFEEQDKNYHVPLIDPCPGCKPGVVCRTPGCGRLGYLQGTF